MTESAAPSPTSRDHIVVEDVNKIPFRTPNFTTLPRLILFHHLFGSTIFREAVFPVALYVWLWERMIPRFYRDEWVQVVSRDTKAELVESGFDPERIKVVYNGIDSNLYTPSGSGVESAPSEEPYLLFMGRIKRYKRLDLILEAFANVYCNFADTLRAKLNRKKPNKLALDFPNVDDGLRGMLFIETVLKSNENNAKWTKMRK